MRKYINNFLDFVITKYSFLSLAVQGIIVFPYLIYCFRCTILYKNFLNNLLLGMIEFYYIFIPYLIFTFFIFPILLIFEYKNNIVFSVEYIIKNKFSKYTLLFLASIASIFNLMLLYFATCCFFYLIFMTLNNI